MLGGLFEIRFSQLVSDLHCLPHICSFKGTRTLTSDQHKSLSDAIRKVGIHSKYLEQGHPSSQTLKVWVLLVWASRDHNVFRLEWELCKGKAEKRFRSDRTNRMHFSLSTICPV